MGRRKRCSKASSRKWPVRWQCVYRRRRVALLQNKVYQIKYYGSHGTGETLVQGADQVGTWTQAFCFFFFVVEKVLNAFSTHDAFSHSVSQRSVRMKPVCLFVFDGGRLATAFNGFYSIPATQRGDSALRTQRSFSLMSTNTARINLRFLSADVPGSEADDD